MKTDLELEGRFKQLFSLVLMCLICVACIGCQRDDEPLIQMYFLDVGQGDCILVRTPEDNLLIDAGPEAGQETLCLRLEQLGVKELTLAVFTHADEDHMGGADGVISQIPTREVWFNGESAESESALRLMSVINHDITTVRKVASGEICRFGNLIISVLYPFTSDAADGNEGSIVLKLHYDEIDALLTGDIGTEQEARLLEAYGRAQLACDLYKVAHHGSNTSSSSEFLDALKPRYAVIGCGAANSYGHPMGEALARLETVGATVLRTDLQGEILFESDGKTLTCVSIDE